MPLWYNNVWLGYIDTRKCRNKKAPFFYDLNHSPIYVDDFCRQTGLKRNTWRQSISVEKPDGEIVPALPLISPPNPTAVNAANSQVRRRPTASARRERAARHVVRQEVLPAAANYFSGLFSIARPPSQEARDAALEAAAYLAEVDAREAARQEEARQEEARAAAHVAEGRRASVYLAEAGAREAARQEAARPVRPVARPAPAVTLDISEREMYLISLADTADHPKSAAGEEKVCVICHEALIGGQRLAATGCGHVFCAGCIGMSLRHKDVCPTCRVVEPTVTLLYI